MTFVQEAGLPAGCVGNYEVPTGQMSRGGKQRRSEAGERAGRRGMEICRAKKKNCKEKVEG